MARTGRKVASVFFAIAILVLLFSIYVALVYHGDVSAGADVIAAVSFGGWIAGFAVALAFIFVIILITFLGRNKEEPAVMGREVTITCRDCGRDYVITDTGERPLLHACPHCGFTDQYPATGEAPPTQTPPEPEPVPMTTAEPAVSGPMGPESLVIHCTNCGTNFDTPFTDERPLVLTCKQCGKRGILRADAPVHSAGPDANPSTA